ncbi:MAG: hypothetical protein ACK5UE_05550 [Chitinophagales bacterium]|jgi:hypothetical protein|nr:hypothetical protein [Sphingobacteriales bacterium]
MKLSIEKKIEYLDKVSAYYCSLSHNVFSDYKNQMDIVLGLEDEYTYLTSTETYENDIENPYLRIELNEWDQLLAEIEIQHQDKRLYPHFYQDASLDLGSIEASLDIDGTKYKLDKYQLLRYTKLQLQNLTRFKIMDSLRPQNKENRNRVKEMFKDYNESLDKKLSNVEETELNHKKDIELADFYLSVINKFKTVKPLGEIIAQEFRPYQPDYKKEYRYSDHPVWDMPCIFRLKQGRIDPTIQYSIVYKNEFLYQGIKEIDNYHDFTLISEFNHGMLVPTDSCQIFSIIDPSVSIGLWYILGSYYYKKIGYRAFAMNTPFLDIPIPILDAMYQPYFADSLNLYGYYKERQESYRRLVDNTKAIYAHQGEKAANYYIELTLNELDEGSAF